MRYRPVCPTVAVLALSVLLSGPAAVAQIPSSCPPAPEPNPSGDYAGFGGATYVTRDAVSCRILLQQFGWNQDFIYEFWWAEGSMDHIRTIAETGLAVVFVDQVMTTPPVRVVEFYNRQLDHYFITIEGVEAAGIDAGLAGPGWERTGLGFTAWQLDPNVGQQISVDLCRFYGSPTIGPNSHFHAAAGPECDGLKALAATTPADQPKWNYEGPAFRVERALTRNGTCLPSTIPVTRLYNNGQARGIDANHRYTLRHDVADQMVRQGWVLEGTAFCAKF